MALPSGTRLGVYEVIAPLGAGGMAEVYRARDTKLNREVALKVLPDEFASDPDRVSRFEREAQLLASVNHPHIAAIYGIEGQAIVLELVDGPTLSDRIAAGPLSIEDALPIARQIAEALEAAHEKGVVHRDLKPGNIKLTSDGEVKVLDFGLAKLLEREGPAAGMSHSPTLTAHSALVLGAFALCALLLTALGLYGLLALRVTERTKEIGVRIALGAHVGQLVRRLVGEGLVLMGAGALVGVLGAALLLRAMRTLLFGVTPQDVTTYVGVIGVLFAVALLASYIPARRVARVEPLTALRQD